MKLGLAIRELHRSERKLELLLRTLAARHYSESGIYHLALDLAGWSESHVRELAEIGQRHGVRLSERGRPTGPGWSLQRRVSELLKRRPEPGLLLLADLRRVHRSAAGVSLDWELLAQGAQAVKDEELLAVTSRCHPQTLRQMRWANAMLKELSPQVLTS
jgi:hypothetical protein